MLTVKGLVIKERPFGDNDKFLSILTDTNGLLDVYARGVKKTTAKNASVSQTFCYATFCLSVGKNGGYTLNSAEPIRLFYDIRLDLSRLSLASYFFEMIMFACVSEQPNEEVLRLTLNSLHFLSGGSKDETLIKAIFELRFLSEIGLTPNLIGCCKCYKYSDEMMQFDLSEGKLYCENCCGKRDLKKCEPVDETILHALRHIALVDQSRLFSFRMSNEYLEVLSKITERYVKIQLGKSFQTLDFYRSVKDMDIR